MGKTYDIPDNNSQMVEEPVVTHVVQSSPVFTNYQMQILDSIANVRDDEEMRDIRNLIAEYFSNKALDAMDKLCDDGILSDQTIESWQTEHMRTPYK